MRSRLGDGPFPAVVLLRGCSGLARDKTGVYHGYDLTIKGTVLSPVGTEKADRKVLQDTRRRMIAFFKKHFGNWI